MTFTRTPEPRQVRVRDLRPGDIVDLAGDKYADLGRENVSFEYELSVVCEVVPGTDRCCMVGLEGEGCSGFPPDWLVWLHGHESAYDVVV